MAHRRKLFAEPFLSYYRGVVVRVVYPCGDLAGYLHNAVGALFHAAVERSLALTVGAVKELISLGADDIRYGFSLGQRELSV